MRANPRVVLVHGTRDSAASFEPVCSRLADLDVVTYTRRGWDSTSDIAPVAFEAHVDDLLAVLDETPSVVVGHSWGGKVVIGAAIRRPELVRSIGLWETSMLWMPGWPSDHGDQLRRAMERVRAKLHDSPGRQAHRARFLEEAGAAFVQHFHLEEVSVPCVVGVGGRSLPVFVKGMQQLAGALGAEVFELPDAGHMAHREDPQGFAAFVHRAIAAV